MADKKPKVIIKPKPGAKSPMEITEKERKNPQHLKSTMSVIRKRKAMLDSI